MGQSNGVPHRSVECGNVMLAAVRKIRQAIANCHQLTMSYDFIVVHFQRTFHICSLPADFIMCFFVPFANESKVAPIGRSVSNVEPCSTESSVDDCSAPRCPFNLQVVFKKKTGSTFIYTYHIVIYCVEIHIIL